MILIFKFFNQFLKHKSSVLILLFSLILSQVFIYFISSLDLIKIDTNGVLNLPIGMIFMPSLTVIFLIGPLFLKYLSDTSYLRRMLLYNENYLSNIRIALVKIIYIYCLSMIVFLINWTLTYGIYLNTLGSKIFFSFFGLCALYLFFLTNLVVFLHKIFLGIKINIIIFVLVVIAFFSFFNLNTFYTYYNKYWPNLELSNEFFIQKSFMPFYYALLGFDKNNSLESVNIFLGNQDKFLKIFIAFYSFSFVIFLINILSNTFFSNCVKRIKSIF